MTADGRNHRQVGQMVNSAFTCYLHGSEVKPPTVMWQIDNQIPGEVALTFCESCFSHVKKCTRELDLNPPAPSDVGADPMKRVSPNC